MNSYKNKIIIATSGTGGHIYPGIALANEFQNKGYIPIFFISNNIVSKSIFKNHNFKYIPFSLIGLPRKFSLKFVFFLFKIILAFFKSIVVIIKLKPIAIIGMGGYISVPIILAAKILRKKTFIHEQNVIPGLANILLSKLIDKTFISFNSSAQYLHNTICLGCPIRNNIFILSINRTDFLCKIGFNDTKPIILIFGGSLGSNLINKIAYETFIDLSKSNKVQIIHVTGLKNYYELKNKVKGNHSYKVFNYIHNIGELYSISDIIICRAGASTIFELQALNKPAILIPYLKATNNHQYWNAQSVKFDNKLIIDETKLTKYKLLKSILYLQRNRNKNQVINNVIIKIKLPQELICAEIIGHIL
ncbi:MAG: UDP-N-acetylglucosamine--N-acetylmuramyl-(pentapeptide) pyrophosphoryl-undecaprenol N-acetylglucosamine transferase [Endomicrobium sp.]|jgi:UDP-N-acetylglucosamine--N-acetylmuramyl-(pentapeptide) pyrophosphoryl-undecaprenol N-acetylglucosamine transferase|nr:UDP-N-acetylglucosamine--N-acetylmuramyl-(pentapeptide) pyrophosphoryl-undecaprenol N-acetylglucosamine transferase [Endomicrobium sp.]